MSIKIENLKSDHLSRLKEFCDREIGRNYFTLEFLRDFIELNNSSKFNPSFIALNDEEIVGIRLTYPPGLKPGLSDSYSFKLDEIAYFQSLFIKKDFQKSGLGSLLTSLSIEVLKRLGVKAILSHSHKESENNSSVKYFFKNGFSPLKEINNYWAAIDYDCPSCNLKPCTCTAIEMFKEI
tara:strand:- start:2531 stop:3070 length:540 start_codon:yes stop_codon:yes gene_type:complete